MGRKYTYIIYKLNDAKTEIVVEKTSSDLDYDAFLADLPEDDCRYAVYNLEYELPNGEGKRDKIIFFLWVSDNALVRSKMVYASSKDLLKRSLNGIAADIQGTDFSEVLYENVLEKATRGTN